MGGLCRDHGAELDCEASGITTPTPAKYCVKSEENVETNDLILSRSIVLRCDL